MADVPVPSAFMQPQPIVKHGQAGITKDESFGADLFQLSIQHFLILAKRSDLCPSYGTDVSFVSCLGASCTSR